MRSFGKGPRSTRTTFTETPETIQNESTSSTPHQSERLSTQLPQRSSGRHASRKRAFSLYPLELYRLLDTIDPSIAPLARDLVVLLADIVAVGLVVTCFELFGAPTRRGFFCDDDSIRYPLAPSQTISTLALVIGSFTTPLIVILVVESIRLFETSSPRDSWPAIAATLSKRVSEVFGVFLFGAGLNQITIDTGKYTVGRLRPHFLEACRPENMRVCSSTNRSVNTYVTDYKCTGDPDVILEARLSFPSGHAALSFYAAVYISIFLQHRLRGRMVRLPRHLTQALLLLVAWFTALSRVHDYMHHPTDVLAGLVIGTVWALLMTTYVINLQLDCSHMTKDDLRTLRSTPNHMQGMNSV